MHPRDTEATTQTLAVGMAREFSQARPPALIISSTWSEGGESAWQPGVAPGPPETGNPKGRGACGQSPCLLPTGRIWGWRQWTQRRWRVSRQGLGAKLENTAGGGRGGKRRIRPCFHAISQSANDEQHTKKFRIPRRK